MGLRRAKISIACDKNVPRVKSSDGKKTQKNSYDLTILLVRKMPFLVF